MKSLLWLICSFATASALIAGCQSNNKGNFIISLQPFAGFPQADTKHVFRELKKFYSRVELLPAIDLPKSAFYKSRNRYRADSLIAYLRDRTKSNHVTIGLTSRDISCTKGEHDDWGIMGLAFRPGSACIVSSFRISKTEKLSQLLKLALHELGHTQGIPHCPVKTCFMRDAEGGNHLYEETDFCASCKSKMIAKGWRFR